MIPIPRLLTPAFCVCAFFFLVQCAGAFTVGSVSLAPTGNLYPGDSVNLSFTVFAAAGAAFPSYDDLQFITETEDPKWTYTISVNGVKNTRPVTGGHTVTISGFELGYRNQDEVIVSVLLRGTIPPTASLGENMTMVKIQELDARGYVIPYSVVTVDHLVGEPAPPPTPAYGSIAVITSPAGADIYIDNVYKGLSPALFEGVSNGDHSILIRLDTYQEVSKRVTVHGNNQTVQATLYQKTTATITTPSPGQIPSATVSPSPSEQSPGYGSLSVTTTPPGALVYVDGAMKGVSPTTVPMLTEGTHSIVLVMDGYEDLRTTITINSGTTSEYITGLSKTTKAPGFGACITVLAVSVLFLFRKPK